MALPNGSGSPSRTMHPDTHCLRMVQRTSQRAQGVDRASIPQMAIRLIIRGTCRNKFDPERPHCDSNLALTHGAMDIGQWFAFLQVLRVVVQLLKLPTSKMCGGKYARHVANLKINLYCAKVWYCQDITHYKKCLHEI